MTVVLVCGGRDYADAGHLYEVLDAAHDLMTITTLVVGGARGADTLAENWARARGIHCRVFVAQWGLYGLSAGPRRNQWMLEQTKPEYVISFPGGTGTAHMMRISKAAGVTVLEA
jgi:hypothetical protein